MGDILDAQNKSFYHDIKSILQTARDNAYKSVNFIMVEAYWNIGKKIVEVEQNGETKAKYGSKLISELSKQLTVDFGSGLTIITGETGAGKSILLGGLSLILGKRADLSSVKDPSEKCIIEATFDIAKYNLKSLFKEEDLD